MELPERITAWREYRGMTRQELATEVGVTRAAAYHWEATDETGVSPRQETLEKIVAAFKITMAQFWGPIPTKRKAS